MASPNRPGPYRTVADAELRDIFFLTPQSGQALMISVKTGPFPGSTNPAVTPLLREMLYLLVMKPAELVALRRRIEHDLAGRDAIPIRAKLLSLVVHVFDEPWAFPALLDTPRCRAAYKELGGIANVSGKVSNLGTDPVSDLGVAAGLKKLFGTALTGMAAFGVSLTHYFGGRSQAYYSFYAKRISDELALRGIPPSSL